MITKENPNTVICDSCETETSVTNVRDWGGVAGGQMTSYLMYENDGKHYCGRCATCRACQSVMRVEDLYRALQSQHGQKNYGQGPLCPECLKTKRIVLNTKVPLLRLFTETDGKPLKSLLKLSTKTFKLKEYIEFKNDKNQVIQVGWFYDTATQRVMRLTQFLKTEKFNSKGKPIPNRFDRRGIEPLMNASKIFLTNGNSSHNLLVLYSSFGSHMNHYAHFCRAIGYRAVAVKHRGRKSNLTWAWTQTLSEHKIYEEKMRIDRELGKAIRDDMHRVDEKYFDRRTKINWVEEHIPKRN